MHNRPAPPIGVIRLDATAQHKREQPLYEEIASRLTRLIDEETFRAGDRLPSVRSLSRDWSVSVTTVLEAYRHLENRGLIEARPKSGHYVRPRLLRSIPEPELTRPPREPLDVSLSELMLMIVRDSQRRGLLQLGAAVPSPHLLPTDKLNRTLASASRRMKARSLAYEFVPGSKALRTEIARRAVIAGCALNPDDIIITSGAMEAVSLTLQVLCPRGSTVAVESPMFFGFIHAFEALGLRTLEIPTCCREGMSVEALRFALDNHPVSAVLASPNFSNPQGSLMPDARKREMVEMLASRGIPLIEDDLYGDLPFGEERPHAAKAFDTDGTVLWCGSYSKTLAPGWRVGWIAPGRHYSAVERFKAALNLACATPTQVAVAEFLSDGGYDHHLRRFRRILAEQMRGLRETVAATFPTGTRLSCPKGGLVLWIELPAGTDSVVLYRDALRENIAIAPGVLFSAKPQYRHCLRLNAAYATEEARASVRRLGELAFQQSKPHTAIGKLTG